jgi:hypothetical protein
MDSGFGVKILIAQALLKMKEDLFSFLVTTKFIFQEVIIKY